MLDMRDAYSCNRAIHTEEKVKACSILNFEVESSNWYPDVAAFNDSEIVMDEGDLNTAQ